MKKFKIYGEEFELQPSIPDPVDAYALRGVVYDDPPKGKVVGYVYMRDGSAIECYKRFNLLVILLPILLLLLIGGGVFVYLKFFQPKDVIVADDFVVKQGTDHNVVSYNGFMAIRDGSISVCFQNGSEVATIQVTGDGISSERVTIQPNEYVASIPASFETDEGVVNAVITIETPTSSTEENVVVEVPENNTPDSSTEGLEGYWKGEYVYGVDIEESGESD